MWFSSNSSHSKPLVASLFLLLSGQQNVNGQLCSILLPCSCILGECGILGALIGNAGEGCVTAADCTCDGGFCASTLTASPTKKPTPEPSPSPSTSLVPSASNQPSDGGGGGILGTALCTDLLDPLDLLGLTIGCVCVNLGLTSGCANSIDLLGDVAEVCLLDDDCACNEVTGQCESTNAPNPTPTTPESPTLLQPVLGLALCTDILDPLLGTLVGCVCADLALGGGCGTSVDLIADLTEVCLVDSDCQCNEATGKCESVFTSTPSISNAPSTSSQPSGKPSASFFPSTSLKPSETPSTSVSPSTSAQPSATGGDTVLSLCTTVDDILGLEIGCTCVSVLGLGSGCGNPVDLVPDLAEVCIINSDCQCNAATGKCESLLTTAPSLSSSPSVSAKPSSKPSSSLAPSTSSQPSVTGGDVGLSLCTDLDLLGLQIGCTCVDVLGVGSGCGNALDLTADLAEVCALNSDCQCNAATGKCESLLTTAPSLSSSPSVSAKPSSKPSSSLVPSNSLSPSIEGGQLSPLPSLSILPSFSQFPSSSEAPSESGHPSLSSFPSDSFFPSLSINPSGSFEPSSSRKPSISLVPSTSLKPSFDESGSPSVSSSPSNEPSMSSSPSISTKPSMSSIPSSSLYPSASLLPSLSTDPTLSVSPSKSQSPSLSSSPSISSSPSNSFYPTTSLKPSTSFFPSVSLNPSANGSGRPSVSSLPSIEPSVSSSPSISIEPSLSASPSTSTFPSTSSIPSSSTDPTISVSPSKSSPPTLSTIPSVSIAPTSSLKPSVSFQPSDSTSPSLSISPSTSSKPSESSSPSSSIKPSSSFGPTSSFNPSRSLNPSVSQYPTTTPSFPPSASVKPSTTPSFDPSTSTEPSNSPSTSSSPSESLLPTKGPDVWYPDWTGRSGTCLSDGNQPDYMNVAPEHWLVDNLYDCCRRYYNWDYDNCVKKGLMGSDPDLPPDLPPNAVLKYKSQICFASSYCPTILNNLDEAVPIFGNAIFSSVCNGMCEPGDTVNLDSVCGQDINMPFTYAGNRRLQQSMRRKTPESDQCLEFTIMLYVPCASDATPKYNSLYNVLETSPTQYYTLQSIQTFVQVLSAYNLPELAPFVITSYQSISAITVGLSSRYYPDWGRTETCKNDGCAPSYMTDTPSYFSSSLEECCDKYYYWKKDECLNENDMGMVMVPPPCYSNTTGSGGVGTGGRYYPDWRGGDICVSDGNEPDYMLAWPSAWIFDNLRDCCYQHYEWDLENCLKNSPAQQVKDPCTPGVLVPCPSNAAIAATTQNFFGDYYPDWNGDRCISDGNAPQYMKNHPDGWIFDNIVACCFQHFSWTLRNCLGYDSGDLCPAPAGGGGPMPTSPTATPPTMGGGPTPFTPPSPGSSVGWGVGWYIPTAPAPAPVLTDQNLEVGWYVDWMIYRCVKSCYGDLPCGGIANYWEETYDTAEECCSKNLSFQDECTP